MRRLYCAATLVSTHAGARNLLEVPLFGAGLHVKNAFCISSVFRPAVLQLRGTSSWPGPSLACSLTDAVIPEYSRTLRRHRGLRSFLVHSAWFAPLATCQACQLLRAVQLRIQLVGPTAAITTCIGQPSSKLGSRTRHLQAEESFIRCGLCSIHRQSCRMLRCFGT